MDHTECLKIEELITLKAGIKANEMRLHQGDLKLQNIESLVRDTNTRMRHLEESHNKVSNRLFVDNGTISFQTKVDRQTSIIKVIIWITGVFAACTITLVVSQLFKLLSGVH